MKWIKVFRQTRPLADPVPLATLTPEGAKELARKMSARALEYVLLDCGVPVEEIDERSEWKLRWMVCDRIDRRRVDLPHLAFRYCHDDIERSK